MKLRLGATVKERTLKGFGERLAKLRKSRGMTQADLAKAVGVSTRVVAYYEGESGQPPGALLVDLAPALRVTADELLGLRATKERPSPRKARLLKRLEKVDELPPSDQRAVLKYVDALFESRRRNGNGRGSSRTAAAR